MKYDVDYFIKKFKAIPANKWCTYDFYYNGKHCAVGHCGVKQMKDIAYNEEAYHLLYKVLPEVMEINDNDGLKLKQKTPKGRILAALRKLKTKS